MSNARTRSHFEDHSVAPPSPCMMGTALAMPRPCGGQLSSRSRGCAQKGWTEKGRNRSSPVLFIERSLGRLLLQKCSSLLLLLARRFCFPFTDDGTYKTTAFVRFDSPSPCSPHRLAPSLCPIGRHSIQCWFCQADSARRNARGGRSWSTRDN